MTYRVTYKMDDNGWWFVDAPDVPGAHSNGQTIARAQANIREAIAGMLDLPGGVEATMELEESYDLPDDVKSALCAVRHARDELEKLTEDLRESTDNALATLQSHYPDMGLRDRAALLGVSFQRIAQLRPGAPRRGRRPTPVR